MKEFCHETTFYNWKKRFGTIDVEEVRQLKTLQQENARLKRLMAERDLEIDVIKEKEKKVVGVSGQREAVAVMISAGMSERRSCGIL